MHESGDSRLSRDSGYPFSTLDVDVMIGEVSGARNDQYQARRREKYNILGFVVPANKIINDVRVTNTLRNLVLIAEIPFLRQTL
jgi:hypothetical protein